MTSSKAAKAKSAQLQTEKYQAAEILVNGWNNGSIPFPKMKFFPNSDPLIGPFQTLFRQIPKFGYNFLMVSDF